MHGSQTIYPVSSVAIEHEKRHKKHRRRQVEEEEVNTYAPELEPSIHDCLDDEQDLGPYDRQGRLVDTEPVHYCDVDEFDRRDWDSLLTFLQDAEDHPLPPPYDGGIDQSYEHW